MFYKFNNEVIKNLDSVLNEKKSIFDLKNFNVDRILNRVVNYLKGDLELIHEFETSHTNFTMNNTLDTISIGFINKICRDLFSNILYKDLTNFMDSKLSQIEQVIPNLYDNLNRIRGEFSNEKDDLYQMLHNSEKMIYRMDAYCTQYLKLFKPNGYLRVISDQLKNDVLSNFKLIVTLYEEELEYIGMLSDLRCWDVIADLFKAKLNNPTTNMAKNGLFDKFLSKEVTESCEYRFCIQHSYEVDMNKHMNVYYEVFRSKTGDNSVLKQYTVDSLTDEMQSSMNLLKDHDINLFNKLKKKYLNNTADIYKLVKENNLNLTQLGKIYEKIFDEMSNYRNNLYINIDIV